MLFELAEIAAWQVSVLSNEICESMIRGSNSRRVRKCPSSRRDRMPGRRERPGNPGHAARVRVLAGDAGSVAPFFPSRLQCDLAETEAGTVATLRETIEPEAGGLPEPRREPAVRPPYPPPSEPDLPGCRPVPLARRDLDIRDGRFEYWDDELTGWTYASLKGVGRRLGKRDETGPDDHPLAGRWRAARRWSRRRTTAGRVRQAVVEHRFRAHRHRLRDSLVSWAHPGRARFMTESGSGTP